MSRVNVGCGASPTPDWINFDNSMTVRLAAVPALVEILRRLGLLREDQYRFAIVARRSDVRWADASRRLPLADGSVRLLYSSHMIEHLDPEGAMAFLSDVRRVLVPGGWVRLVVPDLLKLATRYATEHDADAFVASTLLAVPRSRGLTNAARLLLGGLRNHGWMYDGPSLVRLLGRSGFVEVAQVPAGTTRIPDVGALNLQERAGESAYVEARSCSG